MSLYDRDDPNAERYRARHNVIQEEVSRKFDVLDKARDPLAYYWKKGVHNLRDTFNRHLTFRPNPEDHYNKDSYDA